jgi:hypothetical protein
MALPLTNLMNQLQVGREMSLLGDYSAAAVYFEGVLAGISKYALLPTSQTLTCRRGLNKLLSSEVEPKKRAPEGICLLRGLMLVSLYCALR